MGKCYRFAVFIILFIVYLSVRVQAQEVLVSIDSENKIDLIDAKMEEKLLLFQDYPEFQEARMFRVSDSYYVLEVTYNSDGRLAHHRKSMTASEVESFRRKVTDRIDQRKNKVKLNQEGRDEFLLTTTVNSLVVYGNTLPLAFQVTDSKGYVALYLLTSAAGFFVPYLLTENAPVPYASSTLGTYGSIGGLAHGYFIYNIFNGGKPAKITDPGPLACMTITSMAETVIGYAVAANTDMTPGTAAVISSLGTFGMGFGIGTAVLTNNYREFPGNSVIGSVSALVGASAGFAAGAFLANTQPYTRGDATVLTTSGFLGAYVPCSVVMLFGNRDKKWYTGAAMAGSALGLFLGDYLVREKDFTRSQGNYIALGTLASGIVGAGIGYALADDGSKLNYVYSIGAVGAAVGFGAIYAAFSKHAIAPARLASFDLDFSPAGLASAMMNKSPEGLGGLDKFQEATQPVPVMSLRYKF